jgi:hypothetical protein
MIQLFISLISSQISQDLSLLSLASVSRSDPVPECTHCLSSANLPQINVWCSLRFIPPCRIVHPPTPYRHRGWLWQAIVPPWPSRNACQPVSSQLEKGITTFGKTVKSLHLRAKTWKIVQNLASERSIFTQKGKIKHFKGLPRILDIAASLPSSPLTGKLNDSGSPLYTRRGPQTGGGLGSGSGLGPPTRLDASGPIRSSAGGWSPMCDP